MNRLSIVEVVGRYTELKRSGKEWRGLCPFHAEKTPSFFANEEKGVFRCHGCLEGGDVIRFIERMEGLSFPQALAHLGLTDQPKPTREKIKKRERVRQASRKLATWALSVSERVGTQMRELGQRAYMAQKVLRELPGADNRLLWAEIRGTEREWEILSTLDEDLVDPKQVGSLWTDQESIEQLVGINRTYSNEEIENMYPPLTEAYRKRLTRYVRGEA